ncbi:hypothetical protein [Desulfitobacterium metallireducens]|uniref:Uncharacterized protein n=1 Tax=Desulfitobacterium metallireducens DSM 15288 TaxID=871968 RepID=W0EI27_9FIRM|nr:hypothetical protein [Desulfitobacterium metallireducens]AHF08706.1 hypothetical protein DESME_15075 [Desulfitobacterium metallireducens DSM 15288]
MWRQVLRSGSKIILEKRCLSYDQLSEKEKSTVMQAYFENRLFSMGEYIVVGQSEKSRQ